MSHRFRDEWLTRAAAAIPGVTPDKIEALRKRSAPFLSQALVDAALATPETLAEALRQTHRLRMERPKPTGIDKLAVELIPEKLCRRYHLVPLRLAGDSIEVGMTSPLDLDAQADVQAVSGRQAVPVFVLPGELDAFMAACYNPENVVIDLIDRLAADEVVEVLTSENSEDGDADAPAKVRTPVIKLVNALIAKAVNMNASDIHIEHEEAITTVRYRIDGDLRVIMSLPHDVGTGAVVARLKIMADLDIADRRRPQDGRANIRVGGREMGLRVSTLPTNFGEKVVMRILDPRMAELSFEKLGLNPKTAERVRGHLGAAQGMILVTGPTGAGKTTTLYAILNRLKSHASNIVTIEDPIEYKLEGINQTQVKEKQGLTFASVLRSVLRQDPDIIMLGEIRDRETADIAFQSALTGHLVLTTLHTNDSIATLSRLKDMGVEPFKIASGLLSVSAQRLARRLCEHCRHELPSAEIAPALRAALSRRGLPERAFAAKGCEKCSFSGYAGRVLLLELLDVGGALRQKVTSGASEEDLRKAALASGELTTLEDDALWHVSQGDTSPEEVSPFVRLAASPAAPPDAPAQSTRPRRVLITDDDKTIRFILRRALETSGFVVDEAENGLLALEKIAHDPPDLLLLDLDMPELDGYGVVGAVRKTLGLFALPIIILTASADDKSQETAINLGADDFIAKPFKPAVVLARVNALFRRVA